MRSSATSALVTLAVIAACSRSKPESSPGSSTPPPPAAHDAAPAAVDAAMAAPVAIDAAASACDQLSRKDCIASTACTLWHVADLEYECRPAQTPCETGLVQTDRTACTARAGCKFIPGECYCDCAGYGHTKVREQYGGCACACAGGPPSRCAAK